MGHKESISSKVKLQLIIISSIVSLLLIVGAYFYYLSEKNRIFRDKVDDLEAITNLKIGVIVQWNKERYSEARYFSGLNTFKDNTKKLFLNKNDRQLKKYFIQRLGHIKGSHAYENIFISSVTGEILFSLDSGYTQIDTATHKFIRDAINQKKVLIKDFYYCNLHHAIHLDIVAPIIYENNTSDAALVLRVNPKDYLYPLIQTWPLPSETAEILIFRKEKNHVLFLNELRHKKNADLNERIPYSREEVIAVIAALGKKGIIESKDYRNVDVTANAQKIQGTPWFIIAKIDNSEIYSELGPRVLLISIVTIISILLVGSGLTLLYNFRKANIYKEKFLKEKELAETVKKFHTILYSIGDGVITTDMHGFIVQMNNVAEKLTGWTESEAAGKDLEQVFKIISEDTNEVVENPVKKILKEGRIVGLANHTILISKNGKEIPISDSGSPIRDERNEIIGIVLVFNDMTNEYEAQKKLQESELKFSTIFKRNPAGIMLTELETGKFIDVNKSFLKICGYTKEEVLKLNSIEIGLWKSIEERKRFVEALKKDGRVENIESEYHLKSGLKRNGQLSSEIIQLDSKNIVLSILRDVTDQKNAEAALKESEERYRCLFQDSHSIMLLIDPDTADIIDANPEACNYYGYSLEEITKMKVTDINLSTKEEVFRELSAARQESRKEFYFQHRLATGEIRDVEIYSGPINLNSKLYLYSIIHDITERKLTEKALKESEDKFSKAFKISPDSISINRLSDGTYVEVNQGFCNTSGYKQEEVLGKTANEINIWAKPEDREKFIKMISQNGYVRNFEAAFIMKNGGLRTGLVSARIITTNGEQFILSISRDITERKQSEEKIRKLSRGVEQSPAVIVITDINGNIEYTNPKFTEVTGYTFEEVKGKNPRILKSGDKPLEEYGDMWKTLMDKKEWRGEFLNKKKNGELYWDSTSISPILNEHGEITNFIAVKENITEWKKMTSELIMAKEKAEEMNRVKSYFYANISHELRTPFVGIIGFAELLADTLQRQEDKEMAEIILKSSKRLIDTLNKILNIAKLEFDKPEIHPSSIDVNEVLKNLQVLYSKSAEMQNTIIKTKFNNEQLTFKTDDILLHEILTNLVSNAVKYTPNGLIEMSAEKILKNKKEYLTIKVADTGIGIPKEKQDIIWHEFRQVSEGFSRSFEGTGLGLSIVKKYVELLGGNVFLESEAGKGSVFTIELPILLVPDITNKIKIQEIPEDKEIKVETETTGKTILLVEDDRIAAEFVRRILSANYKVDLAESAEKALEKTTTNLYSALLIDINLGFGMDGVELMQIIKEKQEYKTVPMIAVTAYASNTDQEEFLAKGFSHYISKPFASSDMTGLLREIFN